MKYKVGDKVKIRADLKEGDNFDGINFVSKMSHLCDKIVTIAKEDNFGGYTLLEDEGGYSWAEGMFEDEINHPPHYTDGKIETIDFIEDKKLDYHLGTVIKYISRAGKKDPNKYIQDLEKAKWFLDRKIKVEKEKENVR